MIDQLNVKATLVHLSKQTVVAGAFRYNYCSPCANSGGFYRYKKQQQQTCFPFVLVISLSLPRRITDASAGFFVIY